MFIFTVIPIQDAVNTNVNLTETTGVHNVRPGCSIRIPEQSVTPGPSNLNNQNQENGTNSSDSITVQVTSLPTQLYSTNHIPRPTGTLHISIVPKTYNF